MPFNGHLSMVPVGIYQALFHTVGMGSYWPYRIVGLAGLAVLGFQVTRWCGVRLGPLAAVIAVGALHVEQRRNHERVVPVPDQLLAADSRIGCYVVAPRPPAGSRHHRRDRVDNAPGTRSTHEAAVGLWLALALATSGLGVMAAAAVLVELLLRRAPRRTWLAWVLPVGVWMLWWVGHRESNEISTRASEVVPYFLRMLWGGPTSIAAGNKVLGAALGILLVAWVPTASIRARRLDPRVGGALVAALAFAGLTSLTRQGTFPPIVPDEPRYAWTIGAYLLLAAVAQATVSRPSGRRSGESGTRTDPSRSTARSLVPPDSRCGGRPRGGPAPHRGCQAHPAHGRLDRHGRGSCAGTPYEPLLGRGGGVPTDGRRCDHRSALVPARIGACLSPSGPCSGLSAGWSNIVRDRGSPGSVDRGRRTLLRQRRDTSSRRDSRVGRAGTTYVFRCDRGSPRDLGARRLASHGPRIRACIRGHPSVRGRRDLRWTGRSGTGGRGAGGSEHPGTSPGRRSVHRRRHSIRVGRPARSAVLPRGDLSGAEHGTRRQPCFSAARGPGPVFPPGGTTTTRPAPTAELPPPTLTPSGAVSPKTFTVQM